MARARRSHDNWRSSAIAAIGRDQADHPHWLRWRHAGSGHDLHYLDVRLSGETAALARGAEAVCPFVNDELDRGALEVLASLGVRLIVLRSAGFNHVDLGAARHLNLVVARVPAYSPHAVAEHTIALILSLNRRITRAYNRVREGNFALDGLLGNLRV